MSKMFSIEKHNASMMGTTAEHSTEILGGILG